MLKRFPGALVVAWIGLVAMGGAASAQERPALEAQCRREVEQRYPPGSLSRGRNERQRLIDACVANGGRLPP